MYITFVTGNLKGIVPVSVHVMHFFDLSQLHILTLKTIMSWSNYNIRSYKFY